MLRRVLVAIALTALVASPAAAHDGGSLTHKAKYLRAKVVQQHGKRAPGRDIIRRGLRNGTAPSKRQKAKYVRQLRAMLFSGSHMLDPGRPLVPPAQSATLHAGGTLAAIAACESGGNPRAIGGGGKFRGKYQFDYGTWAGVGGTGDPAAAPEAEQDRRAAMLYAQRGAAPWPVCGR